MCWSLGACCCCVSLEVGAQVISILSTVFSVLMAALYGSAAVYLHISQVKLVAYAAVAAGSGLQALCGALLIAGAFRRKPFLMWPWLVAAWISGVGLLVISMAGSLYLVVKSSLTEDAYVIISAYVLYSLVLLYCAGVVNSRRVELLKERQEAESAQALMTRTRYPHAWKYA